MKNQVMISFLALVVVGGIYYSLSGSQKDLSARIDGMNSKLQETSSQLHETSTKLAEVIAANEKNQTADAKEKPSDAETMLRWKQGMCTSLNGTWMASSEKCEIKPQFRSMPITAASGGPKKPQWTGLPKNVIGTGVEVLASGQTQCASSENDGYCEKAANGESFAKCRKGKRVIHEEATSKKGHKKIRYICVKP